VGLAAILRGGCAANPNRWQHSGREDADKSLVYSRWKALSNQPGSICVCLDEQQAKEGRSKAAHHIARANALV
jgi:hypothetical protein